MLAQYDPWYTAAHVLAEVSNLTDWSGPERMLARKFLRDTMMLPCSKVSSKFWGRWRWLPTPKGNGRDEREYVISQTSSTGGIQRFKAGDHGAAHRLGAMIGYIQEQTTAHWSERVGSWISDLSGTQDVWSLKDLLHLERQDAALRMAVFRSSHERRNGLADIELRHLWLEMN